MSAGESFGGKKSLGRRLPLVSLQRTASDSTMIRWSVPGWAIAVRRLTGVPASAHSFLRLPMAPGSGCYLFGFLERAGRKKNWVRRWRLAVSQELRMDGRNGRQLQNDGAVGAPGEGAI
ncbi:hypothetical protein GQ53DRAFT_755910, partial [Thozetella sp. PMI_491]